MRKKNYGAVTLADIAMLSHISIASVSAVLNGSKNIRVSAANRAKILENARKLNYIPPVVEPALAGHSFIAIWGAGAFVPFWQLQGIIQNNLLRHGYNSVVAGCSVQNAGARYGSFNSPEELVQMGAKGIIFITNYPAERLTDLPIPAVRFGRNPHECDIYYDKIRTFAALIDHLVQVHQRKKLLFVAIHKDFEPYVEMWQQAAKLAGLGDIADQVVSLWQFEGSAKKFFAEVKRRGCDALVGQNDYVAIRLIQQAQRLGIKVPEDLAIVGHDGLSAGSSITPSLTSGMMPIYAAGEAVCQMLYDKLAGKEIAAEPVELSGVLHGGGSCGCAEENSDHLFTRNSYSLLEMNELENFNSVPDNWQQL